MQWTDVKAVSLRVRAREAEAGAGKIALTVRSGGVNSDGPDVQIASA